MGLTSGTRVTAGSATAVAAGGLTAVLYGALHNDPSRTVAGTCITLTALVVLSLLLIRHWIVDTSEERRLLAAAQRQAQAERSSYLAAQAALTAEQGRLTTDRATERRAEAVRLQAERQVLAKEFEEKRADLIAETIEGFWRMVTSGEMAAPARQQSKVIPFPKPHQQPQHRPEPTRPREHGVVSP